MTYLFEERHIDFILLARGSTTSAVIWQGNKSSDILIQIQPGEH